MLCMHIVDVPFTDHRGVSLKMINEKVSFGPGYWKMNDSLFSDHAYIYQVNEIIEKKTYNENINILNIQTVWEICKIRKKYKCILVTIVNIKHIVEGLKKIN